MSDTPTVSITPKPSIPGIWMSSSTRSGESSEIFSTASGPDFASPAAVASGSCSRSLFSRARAGASSSTIRTRMVPPSPATRDSSLLDTITQGLAKGQFDTNAPASVAVLTGFDSRTAAMKQREAPYGGGQPHSAPSSGADAGTGDGRKPVFHHETQHSSITCSTYDDVPAPVRRHTVPDGILHQWLQQQRWYQRFSNRILHIHPNRQAFTEPGTRQRQVVIQQLQLFR